jgi:hypothetical protein
MDDLTQDLCNVYTLIQADLIWPDSTFNTHQP